MTDSIEASEHLLEAMTAFEELARVSTSAQAAEDLDPVVLQAFWREWPHTSVWAGTLWRILNRDLERPATQQRDSELDEVGGTG